MYVRLRSKFWLAIAFDLRAESVRLLEEKHKNKISIVCLSPLPIPLRSSVKITANSQQIKCIWLNFHFVNKLYLLKCIRDVSISIPDSKHNLWILLGIMIISNSITVFFWVEKWLARSFVMLFGCLCCDAFGVAISRRYETVSGIDMPAGRFVWAGNEHFLCLTVA